MSKYKKNSSLGPPKGSLPPTIEANGVTYTCVSVYLVNDIFVFKGNDGSVRLKKWKELDKYKLR